MERWFPYTLSPITPSTVTEDLGRLINRTRMDVQSSPLSSWQATRCDYQYPSMARRFDPMVDDNVVQEGDNVRNTTEPFRVVPEPVLLLSLWRYGICLWSLKTLER